MRVVALLSVACALQAPRSSVRPRAAVRVKASSGIALPSPNQALLTFVSVLAVSNLQGPVSAIIEGSPPSPSLAINGFILAYSAFSLFKSVQKVGYGTLDGRSEKSFAQEAGVFALAGEVPEIVDEYAVATFAGGCFWGTELHFQRIEGVAATCVGYTGGFAGEPTYEQVCGGNTGHTEGIQLLYDPATVSYETLCSKLLDTVDPTILNRVGGDAGTQYRHGVYPHSKAQAEAAAKCIESVQAKYDAPVVTEVKDAAVFWPAENYHQRYLEKKGQSASKDATENVRCYG